MFLIGLCYYYHFDLCVSYGRRLKPIAAHSHDPATWSLHFIERNSIRAALKNAERLIRPLVLLRQCYK